VTQSVPWSIPSAILRRVDREGTGDVTGGFGHTTFELTAPLRLPLYARRTINRGGDHQTRKQTHKPMVIAIDTLRL